jgi:hypothetical protein
MKIIIIIISIGFMYHVTNSVYYNALSNRYYDNKYVYNK